MARLPGPQSDIQTGNIGPLFLKLKSHENFSAAQTAMLDIASRRCQLRGRDYIDERRCGRTANGASGRNPATGDRLAGVAG